MKEVLRDGSRITDEGDILPSDAATWEELAPDPDAAADAAAEVEYAELVGEADHDVMIAEEEAEQQALADAYEAAEHAPAGAADEAEIERRIEHAVDTRGISYAQAAGEVTGQRPEAAPLPAPDATSSHSSWLKPAPGHSSTSWSDAIERRRLEGLEGSKRTEELARQRARRENREERPFGVRRTK